MRFHCIFMAFFYKFLKNYWIPKMGLLPQNQNCRKAGKNLALSSGPNTGVTEGICLPLYTCAPLWREKAVIVEEDNVPNPQLWTTINGSCTVNCSELGEQPRNCRRPLLRGSLYCWPSLPFSSPEWKAQSRVNEHKAGEEINIPHGFVFHSSSDMRRKFQYLASGSAVPHEQCRGSGRRWTWGLAAWFHSAQHPRDTTTARVQGEKPEP